MSVVHKVHTRYEGGGDTPGNAYRKLIEQAVFAALKNEAVDMACVVSVLITDDEGIRKFNLDYRGIDKATDVLSFPMQEFSQPGWENMGAPETDIDTGEVPLGDIIISTEAVQRQAGEYGNTFEQETAYLIIHSTLHLLGYDHADECSEKIMSGKNRQIMKEMVLDEK